MYIDFLIEQFPDATTFLHLRLLIKSNKLSERVLDDVKDRLEKLGLIMHGATVVDVSLIVAYISTRNDDGKRYSEMQ